ncbi:MAG: hypothetical protein KAY50_06265 [Chitinophagaceae bacterium]|nr:hypothetical protein [Chitinophagaceae bacterium]
MELIISATKQEDSIVKKIYGRFYYRDGELVDKELINFQEVNIASYYQTGIELYKRGVRFLKKKGKVLRD